jgi:hypothetical protein
MQTGDSSERDTFEHGPGQTGAVLGLSVGSRLLHAYAEINPGVVFPYQITFRLQLETGLRLHL